MDKDSTQDIALDKETSEVSLSEGLGAVVEETLGLLESQMRLATLEGNLAIKALLSILVASIASVVILLSLWIGLQLSLVIWLKNNGIDILITVSALLFVNVLVALGLKLLIRHNFKYLKFKATLKNFSLEGKPENDKMRLK